MLGRPSLANLVIKIGAYFAFKLMTTFKSTFEKYNWDEIQSKIYASTSKQVEQALAKSKRDLDDFLSLISPAAQPYLY